MNDKYAIKDTGKENQIFFWRVCMAAFVIVIMMSVLVWRYHQLQIVKYQGYKTRSDSNRLLVRPISPPRGLIYDRNGILLADNRPSFSLTIVKEQAKDFNHLIKQLSTLVEITETDIERFEKLLNHRRRPFEPVPIKFNLTEQELGIIAVNEFQLTGVAVKAEQLRHYPLGAHLAHVVGYVGRINNEELQNLDSSRYAGTSLIGKTGLEKHYEDILLGKHGFETVEVNVKGRVMKRVGRQEPVPGQDLTLFMDIRLQQLANQLLEGERGAIAMLDVKTGGVLAMASGPSFDPNPFVTGISHKAYDALLNSPDRPLYDRALQGQYPPGSTLKPVYGLAVLDSGVVATDHRVFDPGYFQLEEGGRKFRDWKKGGHGWADLHTAIVQSCDVYFYNIGIKVGIDTLSQYAEIFGIGQKTGLDIPSERSGIRPSREWKQGAKGLPWYPGDTVNTSIGQGYTLATPMQLAIVAARLATRGNLITPQLVNHNPQQHSTQVEWPHINIADAHWNYIINAMEDVVHHPRGTAHTAAGKDLNYRIAGKTGTAQVVGIKQGEEYDEEILKKSLWDHALFIAFAPINNPKVAIAIIVENGQHGSSTAAPIARKMFDAYLDYYPENSTFTTPAGDKP